MYTTDKFGNKVYRVTVYVIYNNEGPYNTYHTKEEAEIELKSLTTNNPDKHWWISEEIAQYPV